MLKQLTEHREIFYLLYYQFTISIEQYGPERATFPTKVESVDNLRMRLSIKQQRINEKIKKIKDKSDEAKEKVTGLSNRLTKKSKKLLEMHGEKSIEEYIKTYYTNANNVKLGEGYMSPSAAAVILENILNRKGMTWEKVADSYAEILGKKKLEDDRSDIENIINSKVNNLEESIMSNGRNSIKREER